MPEQDVIWDVFISHASEDKTSFVEPLASAIEQAGYTVWYDRFTLKWGDSLRQSIDRGLSYSRYGIVVLSPAFFRKRWPKVELDALLEREASSQKVILPIWHEIGEDEVRSHSPIIAGRLAIRSDEGIDNIIIALKEILGKSSKSDLVEQISDIPIEGTHTDIESLARNIWWIAKNSPSSEGLQSKLEIVLNELRDIGQRPTVEATEQSVNIVTQPIKGPSRFDKFVAVGRSGSAGDVDWLMRALVTENDLATAKLVDYVLGLVNTIQGEQRIQYYLFNGDQKQRNYAALYFKRKQRRDILADAYKEGLIDRQQAFSK